MLRGDEDATGACAAGSGRIALYSHDAQGLGHLRRNLAVARVLVGGGQRSALMITGAREAATLPMPRSVECLTLPALAKSKTGRYRSRSLGLPLPRLLSLRSNVIAATLESYAPNVFIVDKHALGVEGELGPALKVLRRLGTRIVLGLRDVLDEPEVVAREWQRDRIEEWIRLHCDAVWVYGDQRVYDPVREYGFAPGVAEKVRYTGYLGRRAAASDLRDADAALDRLDLPDGRLAACLLGGGEDGYRLGAAFASAPLPDETAGLLVTGPLMPPRRAAELHRLAAERPRMSVVGSLSEPEALIRRADLVVSMAGYNTVCEVLARRVPTLVVPRVSPRREQLIRAQRFAERELLEMLHPDDLSPVAIGAWLAAGHRRPRIADIDLAGLRALPGLFAELEAAHRLPETPTETPREVSAVAATA